MYVCVDSVVIKRLHRAIKPASLIVSDLITVRDPDDDDDSPEPRTIVAVEVADTKNGATHFWSIEKLRWVEDQDLVMCHHFLRVDSSVQD